MAIQPMNYAMIPPQGNPFMANLPRTLAQGMQLGAMPSQMQSQKQMSALQQELEKQQIARAQQQQAQAAQMNPLQLQQQQLANQMNQQRMQQMAQMNPLQLQQQQLANQMNQQRMQQMGQMSPLQLQQQELANKLTQQKILQMQQDPLSGMRLVGPAAQAESLEKLKRMYGEDSSVYQDAKSLDDLRRKSQQTTMDYQTKLAESMKSRYLTPQGKSILEQTNVSAGLSPTGEPFSDAVQSGDLTPDRANALSQIYQQERRKKITDPTARQKSLLATNIRKTLESINPDDIAKFAGAGGSIKKYGEQALASLGLESEDYDRYKNSLQGLEMLATQGRQFYAGSVQPSEMQHLKDLINPATWDTNPKLAKQMYKTVKDILLKEASTYEDATTIPTIGGASQRQAGGSPAAATNNDPLGIR